MYRAGVIPGYFYKQLEGNMHILQAFEQMQAMLRDLAPVLWSYKESLKEQGFTEEQAFNLTRDYQKMLLEKQ